MGRRRKTETQLEADKKGGARMKRYEESQKEEVVVPKPDERIVTYWEKIGETGSWEQKEYIIKKAKV